MWPLSSRGGGGGKALVAGPLIFFAAILRATVEHGVIFICDVRFHNESPYFGTIIINDIKTEK